VSSRVYRAVPNRVVSGRIFVSYRTVFRIMSYLYCRKMKYDTFKTRHGTRHDTCHVSCPYHVVFRHGNGFENTAYERDSFRLVAVCDTWFLISTDGSRLKEISRVIVCTFWKHGQHVHIKHVQFWRWAMGDGRWVM
jgi:hypothetical protein